MKQLIKRLSYAICMLFPVFVFCDAQAQVRDTLYQITCEGDTTGQYFVFERWQMPPEYATQNIIQLMFEYETECYNDSTNIRVHKDEGEYEGWCFTYDGKGCNAADHHKYIWIHKEPTFQDFVRWVRKKYCS